jgi:hypothetical protein
MTRAIVQTYNIVHEYRKRISIILLISSIIMVLFYVLNIYSVVSHTVTIKNLNSQISAVENIVDDLDAKYLILSSKITPDSLSSYGMSQGKVSEYISKTLISAFGRNGKVSHVAYEQL